MTHEFSERSDQTKVSTAVRYLTQQRRDAVVRHQMARGMGESGDRLVELLPELLAKHREELT